MRSSDLHVEHLSDALAGWSIDVVVSGSIGAVESVRFIRSLRRIGAVVTPWLTKGGSQFVTPTALAWASGREVRQDFSGDASHIGSQDACIVSPASASLIGKLAHGITDTPAAALVTSYLGMGKPILLLPNMHDSLGQAPAVAANLAKLASWGIGLITPRTEEGKSKFPDPETFADECAHRFNRTAKPRGRVLITMGSTRGYIDDVRYISNYSSGGLGSLIAEELYRQGHDTIVVSGASQIKPRVATQLHHVLTNEEMAAAAHKALSGHTNDAQAAILAASVLDFTPNKKAAGKLSSKAHESMTIEMTRTPKIIADLKPRSGIKIGFKLEAGLNAARAESIAKEYIGQYGLSMIVINDLADVDEKRHKAVVYEASTHTQSDNELGSCREIYGKRNLALLVATHVHERLEDLAASALPLHAQNQEGRTLT